MTAALARTVVLDAVSWRARRQAHERRVDQWLAPHLRRLDPEQTVRTVEDNRIRCSHFDAYRFFTAPARPLNLLAPTRDTQHANEQPGCLHANMDLSSRPACNVAAS